ncbi:LysR family transcriptional regulator [Chimaeribacter californicus]|uniref:LysR family transcriptional regulator n=1 Tax=Chimaeribacter californicus TaxID=2060067 RepID=A0A2N5EBV2_9GAMM|nr:LysR family transcriptional regulator [Chimaeribacter californicus]PLR39617.1 LysR family transcriptional regulator [Chimaeribacter californicus]
MKDLKPDALWTHLHWLSVLAEQGSFTRTAERLDVSKAAVSQKIKELEQLAGVPLVRRTTRTMQLTDAGQKLVEELKAPFSEIMRSFIGIRDAQGPLRGRVRVTAPVAFARQQLVPHIIGFMRRYPQVRVQLEVSDRLVSLAAEGFDLAIRHSDTLPETHVAQRLCATRTLMVASPDYLRRHGTPEAPQQLAGHQCLYYPRGSEQPGWAFVLEQKEAQQNVPLGASPGSATVTVPVSGMFATNNSESIRDAAIAGMGIALLPDFSAQSALDAGTLVPLLAAWQPVGVFAQNLYIVRPWSAQVPRAVTAFTAYLRAVFSGETA